MKPPNGIAEDTYSRDVLSKNRKTVGHVHVVRVDKERTMPFRKYADVGIFRADSSIGASLHRLGEVSAFSQRGIEKKVRRIVRGYVETLK